MPSGFKIDIRITNPKGFAMFALKLLGGFEELWDAIIERWQDHNDEKFDEAQGQSQSGVTFDAQGGVTWQPLKDDYFEAKSRDYDDWLMVRDGTLMESLTNPGAEGWFEELTPRTARFGTTLPYANYDWVVEARPVAFLDREDEDTVRDMVGAFLDGRAPFAEWGAVIPTTAEEYHEVVNAWP